MEYFDMLICAVCILSFVEFCLLKVYMPDSSAERDGMRWPRYRDLEAGIEGA